MKFSLLTTFDRLAIVKAQAYNELIMRGCTVDVGVVPVTEPGPDGKRHQKTCEIDFVVNAGIKRYYIQSTQNISDADKLKQEKRPLLAVPRARG